MMKKILFITSTRIGDAVLSTGILSYLLEKHPDARITVACGPLVESLFAGVPRLEKIIPLHKQSWNRHWIALWRQVVRTQWDIVVDLRNSAVSRLIPARERYIYGNYVDKQTHKVSQNASVIGVSDSLARPCLFLTPEQKAKAAELIPDGAPVLGVGPTANWIGKTWPVENFQTLIGRLIGEGGAFAGWRIAVFGAPREEEVAYHLYHHVPSDLRLDCIAKGTPGDAAACLARCAMYIGNDSGLMHTAAAAGIPTLGLFGPTNDREYGPFGDKTAVVRTDETLAELIGAPDFSAKDVTGSLMTGLSVDRVEAALTALKARFYKI